MQAKKIVFLASDCESSRWVYHALKADLSFAAAIIEEPVSKRTLFKNRMKKIGFVKVVGQALFSLLVVPVLAMQARKRKAALIAEYHLNSNDFDGTVVHVSSVNDDTCLQTLKYLQPDIVLVNGTRIISNKILQNIPAVFINTHVGITPKYRGSHGGYWALYNNDEASFGTTIHLVNSGVDTGDILKQVFVKPAKEDNFTTYPVLQVAAGIALLKQVLQDVMNNNHTAIKLTEKGRLYYQPAIWEYFKKRTR